MEFLMELIEKQSFEADHNKDKEGGKSDNQARETDIFQIKGKEEKYQ
jgi:hypothetical protein